MASESVKYRNKQIIACPEEMSEPSDEPSQTVLYRERSSGTALHFDVMEMTKIELRQLAEHWHIAPQPYMSTYEQSSSLENHYII